MKIRPLISVFVCSIIFFVQAGIADHEEEELKDISIEETGLNLQQQYGVYTVLILSTVIVIFFAVYYKIYSTYKIQNEPESF